LPPVGSELRKVESARMGLPIALVPSWAKGNGVDGLLMVPLAWKRPLLLPPPNALDAWFLWSPDNDAGDWELDPRRVQAGIAMNDAEKWRMQSLIYAASITTKNRQHVLSCASLFTSLALKSVANSLWIADEDANSISIWTDHAYSIHFGQALY